MVIITEANDSLTIINPYSEEEDLKLVGKQIGNNAFIAFTRHAIYWAWTLHEFDADIENGVVKPHSGTNIVVDPNGFIYRDEIYKIQIEV